MTKAQFLIPLKMFCPQSSNFVVGVLTKFFFPFRYLTPLEYQMSTIVTPTKDTPTLHFPSLKSTSGNTVAGYNLEEMPIDGLERVKQPTDAEITCTNSQSCKTKAPLFEKGKFFTGCF